MLHQPSRIPGFRPRSYGVYDVQLLITLRISFYCFRSRSPAVSLGAEDGDESQAHEAAVGMIGRENDSELAHTP
jgi:hypothetical protein